MGRAISNRNIQDARFEVAEFEGRWLASIGRPELKGSWLIFGGSGCGKTTFALELCKYLTRFGRVAYDSLEQGLSLSLQTAWERTGMEEAGTRIVLLSKEPLAVLIGRLEKAKSPDIVLLDSITAMSGFSKRDYSLLVERFPNKLFIFIAHEKNRMPDPQIAEHVRRLSEVKIYVEGYKAFFTSRFENAEKGEGGKDFIIWEKGAAEYWADKL